MENSDTYKNEAALNPGEILKRCREFQQMSLQDAAAITKIGVEYLEALEENRIKQFANITYLKGFVRIYAATLGLNSDDIIRLYEKLYKEPAPIEELNQNYRENKKLKKSRFPIQKLIIPAILLILIFITNFFLNNKPKDKQQNIIPPATVKNIVMPNLSTAKIITKPEEKAVDKIDDAEKSEKIVEKDDENGKGIQPQVENIPKGFVLTAKTLKNCKVIVVIDNGEPQEHDLVAGDKIEWQGINSVTIDISDASAIELIKDGKSIHKQSDNSSEKRIVVKNE